MGSEAVAGDPGPARLPRLLTELAAAVDADGGATLLLDDGEGIFAPIASSDQAQPRGRRWFRRARRPAMGASTLIPVPDARCAVVALTRSRAEPFSADDRAVARLYVRQLAEQIVVDGAGVRSSFWSRQLEAIQSVAAQLTGLTTVDTVTAALCTETRRVIPYDDIRVHLLADDGRTLEPVAFRGHHPAYTSETAEGLRRRIGEGLTGAVARSGRALLIPDVAHDPRFAEVPGATPRGDESMVLVPLRHEASVIGVITLVRRGLGMFAEDDLRLLQVLADQVAVAIENARLLAGRDRLVEEFRALLEIGQAGALAADEETLAATLAGTLRSAARMDGCAIVRWDEGGTRLLLLGTDGAVRARGPLVEIEVLRYPASRRVLLGGSHAVLNATDPDLGPNERGMLAAWGAASVMLLPLTATGRVMGVVELAATAPEHVPTADEIELYATMASHAAVALENARLLTQLRHSADIDQVTGVNNHRYLQERLRQEVARATRTHGSLAVLMIDLDGFKLINDRHGHASGDRVLRNVAGLLKLELRTNDVVARYGGDEFVVLMPDTDEQAARRVADRVVKGIRGQVHALADGAEGHVSCSVGMAVHPVDGRTAAALLKSADTAMYGVKRAGGSRVGRLRAHPEASEEPAAAVAT